MKFYVNIVTPLHDNPGLLIASLALFSIDWALTNSALLSR